MAYDKPPEYRLISTIYLSPDGETVTTYGIEAVVGRRVMELPDLDFRAAEVQALIDCLQGADVDEYHLQEIVQDFVQRQGMV